MTSRTYRGRSLEELLPRVRAELGPDAVIVRQREGLTGGVAGFFQKRCVEIEAMASSEAAATPSVDVRESSLAEPPDFLEQLRGAQQRAAGFEPGEGAFFPTPAADPFVPETFAEAAGLPTALDDDAWSDWAADHVPPGPAPAHPPAVVEGVTELVRPGDARVPEANPYAGGYGLMPQGAAPVEGRFEAPPLPAAPASRAPLPAPLPAEIVPLRDALVARGLEAPIADAVVDEAVTHLLPFAGSAAKPKAVLAEALARRIPVRPLGGSAGRVIAFVGPGGAGKTHLAGHLAGAYARGSGLPVACVALRPDDAGAELALLASSAGVPLQVAPDAAAAAQQVGALREQALVLVDTPGVSPRAKGALRSLGAELRAAGADEVVVAIPATMSAGAARELVAAGRRVGATALALTHADETEHLGPAVGVAMQSGLPFAFVGRAPNGRVAVRPASAGELAKALLSASGR